MLAALEMQEALNTYLQQSGSQELALRVSVHGGEAIITKVDGKPLAMGKMFTTAQAIHTTLDPGVIWVDERVHRLASPSFMWQALEGGGYCPLAHLHAVDKGRGLPGLSGPLVGPTVKPDAEGSHRLLQRGVGGIVTIVGEAGIGKSRLVAEVRKTEWQNGESKNHRWVEGRCLSDATHTAFQMWNDVLRALAGVGEGATARGAGNAAHDCPVALSRSLRRRLSAACLDDGPAPR